MTTLIEGLNKELKRNRELLKFYEDIPTGFFGASIIRSDIIEGERAIKAKDPVGMLRAYKKLEKSE